MLFYHMLLWILYPQHSLTLCVNALPLTCEVVVIPPTANVVLFCDVMDTPSSPQFNILCVNVLPLESEVVVTLFTANADLQHVVGDTLSITQVDILCVDIYSPTKGSLIVKCGVCACVRAWVCDHFACVSSALSSWLMLAVIFHTASIC